MVLHIFLLLFKQNTFFFGLFDHHHSAMAIQTQTQRHNTHPSHLHGQTEVLLHQLIVVLGPVGDGRVHLQHADVPRLQLGHRAGLQLGPEGPPVHPLPEVDLLRDDASRLVLPKVLLGQEVLPEQQPGAADVLLVAHDVHGGS